MPPIKKERPCAFCKSYTIDRQNLGDLLYCKDIRAHYYCVLLSSTIKQSGADNEGIYGFVHGDLVAELKQIQKRVCHYCGKLGAGLCCTKQTRTGLCNRYYHLPCGNSNGAMHNFSLFNSTCHTHAVKTNVPKRFRGMTSNLECIICKDNFADTRAYSNVIFAECCNRSVLMHAPCVRQYALSSGYHMRCPACNDREKFVGIVRRMNVFVPDVDVTWDTEQSYNQMYEVQLRCDAEVCVCPSGRDCFRASGPWKRRICYTCGSSSIHIKCSRKKKGRFVCCACTIDNVSEEEVEEVEGEEAGNDRMTGTADAQENTQNESNRNVQNEPAQATAPRLAEIVVPRLQPGRSTGRRLTRSGFRKSPDQPVKADTSSKLESLEPNSAKPLSGQEKAPNKNSEVGESFKTDRVIKFLRKEAESDDEDSFNDRYYKNIIEVVDLSSDDDDDDPLLGIPTLSPQASHSTLSLEPSTSYSSLKRSRSNSPKVLPSKVLRSEQALYVSSEEDDDEDDFEEIVVFEEDLKLNPKQMHRYMKQLDKSAILISDDDD